VTLGNLRALLRIFPHKPFYLTEFGYNTRPSRDFGPQYVSERMQSRYLRQAYTVASRYPQVKALFWYLTQDVRRSGARADGVYTGLRRVNGSKKPSWYAFLALP
jgi:polysaccharide biosynthesis protein PslG